MPAPQELSPIDHPVASLIAKTTTQPAELFGLLRAYGVHDVNVPLKCPLMFEPPQSQDAPPTQWSLLEQYLWNASCMHTEQLKTWDDLSIPVHVSASDVACALVRLGADISHGGIKTVETTSTSQQRPSTEQWDVLDIAFRHGHFGFVHALCANGGPLAHLRPTIAPRRLWWKGNANASWLHVAVQKNHHEWAKTLLSWGCDVNARDLQQRTPLFESKTVEMVELLIAHGADPAAVDIRGQSVEMAWAAHGLTAPQRKPLVRALVASLPATSAPSDTLNRLRTQWIIDLPTMNKTGGVNAAKSIAVPNDFVWTIPNSKLSVTPATWLSMHAALQPQSAYRQEISAPLLEWALQRQEPSFVVGRVEAQNALVTQADMIALLAMIATLSAENVAPRPHTKDRLCLDAKLAHHQQLVMDQPRQDNEPLSEPPTVRLARRLCLAALLLSDCPPADQSLKRQSNWSRLGVKIPLTMCHQWLEQHENPLWKMWCATPPSSGSREFFASQHRSTHESLNAWKEMWPTTGDVAQDFAAVAQQHPDLMRHIRYRSTAAQNGCYVSENGLPSSLKSNGLVMSHSAHCAVHATVLHECTASPNPTPEAIQSLYEVVVGPMLEKVDAARPVANNVDNMVFAAPPTKGLSEMMAKLHQEHAQWINSALQALYNNPQWTKTLPPKMWNEWADKARAVLPLLNDQPIPQQLCAFLVQTDLHNQISTNEHEDNIATRRKM